MSELESLCDALNAIDGDILRTSQELFTKAQAYSRASGQVAAASRSAEGEAAAALARAAAALSAASQHCGRAAQSLSGASREGQAFIRRTIGGGAGGASPIGGPGPHVAGSSRCTAPGEVEQPTGATEPTGVDAATRPTAQDAKAAAILKDEGVADDVDLRGLDHGALVGTLDTLVALHRDYPGVHLSEVTTSGFDQNDTAFAYYDWSDQSLHINPQSWNDSATAEAEIDMSIESGWLSRGDAGVKGMLTHEFGHALHRQGCATDPGLDGEIRSILSNHGVGYKEVLSDLSKYATRKDSEMVAEAFSAQRNASGSAPAWAHDIGDALGRRFR